MFSDAQLNQNPFLRKIMEANLVGSNKDKPVARSQVLGEKPTKKKITPEPKHIPEAKQTTSQFAKTKPTKKQVREFLTERIKHFNSIESEDDE